MTSPDPIVQRLRALETESISDALDAHGLDGRLLPGVRPLWRCPRIAGRVVPVQLVEVEPGVPAPTSTRHLGTAAVDSSGGDHVVLVDNGGRSDVAGWGGLLSRAAGRRAVAGVVVHGAVRDVAEAESLGFPVYGTATTPRTARGRVREVDADVLVLGGVQVTGDDYVIGDVSGVLVVPGASAAAVLDTAEAIAGREAAMARAIDGGTPVSEVMGGRYEHMLGEVRRS